MTSVAGALMEKAYSCEVPDASHRGSAEDELDHHPRDPHRDGEHHDRDVLQEHPDREQHDAERRKRVEPRERRGEKRRERPRQHERAEHDVGEAVLEEVGRARAREALEPPDRLHEPVDEALLGRPGEPESPPALRQPDPFAADYQLKGEQHGHDLEHVRGSARGQRKRRDPQEQDEQQGEALLLEELDDAPERLLAVALQPALELLAGATGAVISWHRPPSSTPSGLVDSAHDG
jgi:hypothetical protein